MKLHGTLMANLQGALTSARRLHDKRVYTGTLEHWQALVDEAHRRFETDVLTENQDNRRLVAELEEILASRKVMGGRPASSRRSARREYR